MRDEKRERKVLQILRTSKTKTASKYGEGGLLKQGKLAPKPVSLPKLPWQDEPDKPT